MFKRIVAAVVATALALTLVVPHVVPTLPDAYTHPAFKNYIKYDAGRKVFTETLALMDSWCRGGYPLSNDEGIRRHCSTPKDVLPMWLIVMRADIYETQARADKSAGMRRAAKQDPLLAPVGTVQVILTQYEPQGFYERWGEGEQKNRHGMRPWRSFLKRVVPELRATPGKSIRVAMFDLEERAYYADLKEEMPAAHTFNLDEVCATIATLCSAQQNGQEGVLLVEGGINVFYTDTCAIVLTWCGEHLGWGVGAWEPSRSNFWTRGDRIFIPA